LNRFFKTEDENIKTLDEYKIQKNWWSRGYEYALAKNFVDKNDTVLDVGCGFEHPFKYFLADNCKKTYAIDIDKRIDDLNLIEKGIKFENVDLIDFETTVKFDKIFCISVFNVDSKNINEKLSKMKKLLKENGKIIITADFPSVNPKKIIDSAKKAGLKCVNDKNINFDESEDDVFNFYYKLKCFSIVLEKTVKNTTKNRKKKVEKPDRIK
jgi:cyclopropane fatty-acyl-phospholipid synthase-like methyltransferase